MSTKVGSTPFEFALRGDQACKELMKGLGLNGKSSKCEEAIRMWLEDVVERKCGVSGLCPLYNQRVCVGSRLEGGEEVDVLLICKEITYSKKKKEKWCSEIAHVYSAEELRERLLDMRREQADEPVRNGRITGGKRSNCPRPAHRRRRRIGMPAR